MFYIKCTETFSAAHCIEGHQLCGQTHGHNWKVTVCIAGSKLNAQGMLLDFRELSMILKDILKRHYDHKDIGSYSAEALAVDISNLVAVKLPPNELVVNFVAVEETEGKVAEWHCE